MPVVVPIRILQGLLYVVGAYFLCASSVLFIRKIVSVPPEVSRKLLHLSAIIVLTVWLYAFADWRITEVTIVVFAVAAHPILLLLLSIKDRSIKDRPAASSLSNISSERSPGELHKSLSASYLMFMLAVGVCWGWLGDRNLALVSIFAWGPGDTAAALVGKRYGKNKIGKMVRHEGGRPDARVGDARVECRAAQEMKVMALRSRRTGGGFKPPHAAGPVTVSW